MFNFSASKSTKRIFPQPVVYNSSPLDNLLIKKAVFYKREGNYKLAIEVYEDILNNSVPSAILYSSYAKTLACNGDFETAIELFTLANNFVRNVTGSDDFNFKDHLDTLKNRYNMSRNSFLSYMRSIAGNTFYELPDNF